LFQRVNERFQRCDVLVNNAGATRAGAFVDLPDAVWLEGYALKFFGCVRLTRLFWPLLKASQGNVVNIIGGAARTPDPEFLIGGSVNAAMANFSKGLSKLGNRDDVNVNAIHPGNTDTERQEQLRQQRAAALGKTVEELRSEALVKNNMRRFGKPEDIAAPSRCSCAPNAGVTSRAPRSRSTAARPKDTTDPFHISECRLQGACMRPWRLVSW
jgi:NAD(P)-dependent dehydrogenase (short-subunit alcohol dehydrogenase family)